MPRYVKPSITLISPELRESYKNAFDAFDEDRIDQVRTEDLGKVIRAIGFNPTAEEIEDMKLDLNSETFTFKAFLFIVYRHSREVDPEAELIDAFRVLDKTGSGTLTVGEIRRILKNLKKPLTDAQINQLVEQANPPGDKDDDKREIEYTRFVRLMLDF
jgi:Ca2+-binding EF-hand superfamily protein